MGTISDFTPDPALLESEAVGCEKMFDQYCDALFSPGAMGNLRIGTGSDTFTIYRGKTANGFSATYYFYAHAKLKWQGRLPADLRKKLVREGYFGALREFLGRKPRAEMTFLDRTRDLRNQHYLDALWNSAIGETVLERMNRIQPGFHRMRESFVPIELTIRKNQVRRKLISEVSLALWTSHSNWQKVAQSFESIRTQFLSVLDDLVITDALKARWKERLSSVRLILPGSSPEVADEECSTTETNAYYYPKLNALTVCAGDFNSEDIYQTLAHELAHAIDFDSMALLHRQQSEFGKGMRRVFSFACGGAALSCEDWNQFKGKFSDIFEEWSRFEPPLEEFQRCLMAKPTVFPSDDGILARVAEDSIASNLSELADNNVFVKLTKEKLPFPDGSWRPNPLYMDACKFLPPRADSDPTGETETLLSFFLAEYQCSEGGGTERLRGAIAQARLLATQALKARYDMEGEFSDLEALNLRGLSSSPAERFADVLGSYALSRVLRQDRATHWQRRKLFLASSAWQCTRPSLSSAFPEEAKVERDLLFDTHLGGKDRVRESMSEPVRRALGCSKDFVFNECVLPLRSLEGRLRPPSN
jgi:hypothetical protein